MAYAYNVNPGTQSGSGTFGAVPGQLSLPSPFSDLGNIYPNLSQTNSQVSGNILSQLQGQLSPETLANLQNTAARFGVWNGMPGANAYQGTLANNQNLLGNIRTTEQLQQQGLQNYNALIPTISGTQTVNPALQAEIASTNAMTAAMPNPADAASYAKELFDQYLGSIGGPAGGTGAYMGGRFGSMFGQMASPARYTGSPYTYFGSTIPGVGLGEGSSPSWMNLPSSYAPLGGYSDPFQGYQAPSYSYNDVPDYTYFGGLA